MQGEESKFGYHRGPAYIHKIIEEDEENLEADFKTFNRNPRKKFLVAVNREMSERKLTHSFLLVNANVKNCANTLYHLLTIFSILNKNHCDEEAYLISILVFGKLYFQESDISYARTWLEEYFPYISEFQTPSWLDLSAITEDGNYDGKIFPFIINLNIKSPIN